MADLKALVQEVVDATKLCPEPLQELAFEILLKHQLGSSPSPPKRQEPRVEIEDGRLDSESADAGQIGGGQNSDEEISTKDLHAKTRKFLQEHSLTLQDLNALYYKEGTEVKPLYDDLRSTGMSESQMRLALLEAFENGLSSGNFEFNGESVREKCRIHKCYDGPNYTRNFRKNANLFDGFESYEANTPIRLSTEGRRRLATVITELARSS